MKNLQTTIQTSLILLILLSASLAYAAGFQIDSSTLGVLKYKVVEFTGQTRDTLHVYVGLIIFGGVSLLYQRSFRSIVPWLVVLAAALLGEFFDMQNNLVEEGYWLWQDSIKDVIFTIVLPSIILFVARLRLLVQNAGRKQTVTS